MWPVILRVYPQKKLDLRAARKSTTPLYLVTWTLRQSVVFPGANKTATLNDSDIILHPFEIQHVALEFPFEMIPFRSISHGNILPC